jgi:hypothetical protein
MSTFRVGWGWKSDWVLETTKVSVPPGH